MKVRWVAILGFVILVASFVSCGSKEQTIFDDRIAAPLRTAHVQREERVIEIAGVIRAADVAQLASRFGGFISTLPVHAGDQVKKGELLVVLDDRNLMAQRDKVDAGKEEARQNIEAAAAQNRIASNTFERIQALYEKKSASKQEFEEAESRKDAAEAAYQAALKRMAQAQSDLQDVSASSEYLRISAPFSGVVTSVSVDAGTFVTPGQTILSIENAASFQVLFSVEEDLLTAVPKGQEITVLVPALGEAPLTASVEEVSNVTDSSTRTFQIKATLAHHAQLRSGLSARIFVKTAAGTSLWIPQEFLGRNNDIETVLVKQQNQWKRILVKSGIHRDGKIEVLSGLNEGEEIGIAEEQK